jgi:hypothetical protein
MLTKNLKPKVRVKNLNSFALYFVTDGAEMFQILPDPESGLYTFRSDGVIGADVFWASFAYWTLTDCTTDL